MGLGLCVIGCGGFARVFAREITAPGGPVALGEVDLFFASRDGAKAMAYCRDFDGRGHFQGYEEAASHPDVQAVYLCTPHNLHPEHTAMAAARGVHVLVEKPIARTVEEGKAMVAAAAQGGITLMVAENYRFMPVVREARRLLVNDGVLGRLRFIQLQEESGFGGEGWRSRLEEMGGGAFIDSGIHSVAIMRELAGPARQISASVLPRSLRKLEGEDGIAVLARLESGATGFINHAWGIPGHTRLLWVSVTGTKGRLDVATSGPSLTPETEEGQRTVTLPDDTYGMRAMVREFAAAISEGRSPLSSGEEGLKDLEVVLAAYRSATSGMPETV